MGRWSVISVLSIMFFGCSSSPPPGETIDLIEGTYKGRLADGELKDRVEVRDEDATLTVRFFEHGDELDARVTLRGDVAVNYLGTTQELDNPEVETVHGVTVDGDELWCVYDASVKNLDVAGWFSADRDELELDVQLLGILWLDRLPEEVEVEEGS